MNPKDSQIQSGRFLRQAAKALCLIASILMLGSFTASHAQDRRPSAQDRPILVRAHAGDMKNCGGNGNQDHNVEIWIGATKRPGGTFPDVSVPPGKHNVSVKVLKPGLVVSRVWYREYTEDLLIVGEVDVHPNKPEDNVSITVSQGPPGAPRRQPGNLDVYLGCGGAAAEKRLPIIFLPGVAGTELWEPWERTDIRGEDRRVWPFRTLSGLPGDSFSMMLDREGRRNANRRVVIGDIFRSRPVNFYGGMIAFLTGKGYKEYRERDTEEEKKRANLFLLPYDWRLDCDSEDHFDRLDQLINQALQNQALQNGGAKKVILLAHSMGGVIARAYLISKPASAAKVDSLISMGTPYWGSVKPYYGLVDGYDFGNHFIFNKTMKILARNFPAAHFLLPQLPFICDTNVLNCDTNDPRLSLDESFSVQYKGYIKGPGGTDDYAESDGLIWNINATLLGRARSFWVRMGKVENPTALPSVVKHYVIIGTGNRTLDGYHLETATDDDYVAIGARRVRGVPLWGDGDITVPLKAAEIKTATETYYVKVKPGMFGGAGGYAQDMSPQSIAHYRIIPPFKASSGR